MKTLTEERRSIKILVEPPHSKKLDVETTGTRAIEYRFLSTDGKPLTPMQQIAPGMKVSVDLLPTYAMAEFSLLPDDVLDKMEAVDVVYEFSA